MVKFAEIVFVVCFLAICTACALAAAYGIATGIVVVIRLFVPGFAEYKHPEDAVKKADHAAVRRVALDYLMQSKRDRENALRHRFHELASPGLTTTMPKLTLEDVFTNESPKMQWSMDEIAQLIQRKPLPETHADTEYYGLAKFPNGPNGVPYWLCIKQSVKGKGLRAAFSPLPQRRMRMDKASANRWATQFGPDVFVLPVSAAARIAVRNQNGEESHAPQP